MSVIKEKLHKNFKKFFYEQGNYHTQLEKYLKTSQCSFDEAFPTSYSHDLLPSPYAAYIHAVEAITKNKASMEHVQQRLQLLQNLGCDLALVIEEGNVFHLALITLPEPQQAYLLYQLAEPFGNDWFHKNSIKQEYHWEQLAWSMNQSLTKQLASYERWEDILLHEHYKKTRVHAQELDAKIVPATPSLGPLLKDSRF